MSEMVERVARAIYASQWGEAQSWGVNFTETMNCRSRARAAIEAMREPTEAMMKDGDIWADGPGYSGKVWHAMIDTALTENTSDTSSPQPHPAANTRSE